MKKHLKKSICFGITLVLLGAAIICSVIGLFPANAFTLIMSAVFLAILVWSVVDLNFTMIGLAVGHGLALYRNYIGIPDALKPWTLILCSVLIGVGFDFIFKDVKKKRKNKKSIDFDFNYDETDDRKFNSNTYDTTFAEDSESENSDSSSRFSAGDSYDMTGNKITISSTFGKQVRYIHSDHFKKAKIENALGNVTVYFDQVTMADNQCKVKVENGVGVVNLYFPAEWALDQTDIENGMGNIRVIGNPSTLAGAPIVHFYAENGVGNINLYFN